ncbi:MAG: hypothetical protein SGI72_06795 [Planctomycetota bacterium]|nr:hypothetical protein [Planctomycetota bacterium]
MNLKSRFLRITLIVLAILAVAGYLAFTTAFYNPMEGSLKVPPGALVPRDVDFFVSRTQLGEAFETFPRLAVMDELEKTKGWQTWIGSPEYAELAREMKIDESLAQLKAALEQIPLGMQPLELFGGENLVLAGYFKGNDLARSDWAAYGRANWAGKLAAAAALHPSWLGLEKQGLKAVVTGEIVALSGGQLPRELFVTRKKDVVVVATKMELAKAVHELESRTYADSFFQSAMYLDHIQNATRSKERREFEVWVNVRKLLENLGVRGQLPNPASQEFSPAFFGRLFQLPSVKNVAGVIGIDEGLTVDLHGEFASETITPEMQKFYRSRHFDQNELLFQAAQMAPADTALFAYFRGDLGDTIRSLLAASEADLRRNVEDQFRQTRKYPTLESVITEIEGALKDRAVIIIRPNDYPPDKNGPPHNDVPVPAIAAVFWSKDVEAIVRFREVIGQNGQLFGLKGRKEGELGYFSNMEAGFETREFWSEFVDGTGVIATSNAHDLTIVTNSLGMLGHILKTSTQGGTKYPRLSENSMFQGLTQSALAQGNVFAWLNPVTLAPILRARAADDARSAVFANIDWKSERSRLEDQVLREQFPGEKRGALTPERQLELDAIVDPKIDAMEKKLRSEQVPAFMAKQERFITYLEQLTGLVGVLSLDPRSFDLSIRVVAPLTPAEQ